VTRQKPWRKNGLFAKRKASGHKNAKEKRSGERKWSDQKKRTRIPLKKRTETVAKEKRDGRKISEDNNKREEKREEGRISREVNVRGRSLYRCQKGRDISEAPQMPEGLMKSKRDLCVSHA